MADIDYMALFGGDDGAAQSQAAALAQAIAKRRALGEAASFLGGPYAGMGKQFSGDADELQRAAQTAGQFRGLHGEDLRQQREARDPTSTVSQLAPQLAKQIGIEVPQGAPYSAYSSLLPEATKVLQAKNLQDYRGSQLGNKDRQLDQGDRRLSLAEKALRERGFHFDPNTGGWSQNPGAPGAGAGVGGPKAAAGGGGAGPAAVPLQGKILDKALKELGGDFDPSGGRAGEFGKNQARVNAAARVLGLAQDPAGNPIDLTPNQMPELMQSVASLISSGGQGTQAQIEHLLPNTLRGNLQGTLQWLTGEPRGADQVAFVKNAIDTAKRERDIAQQGIEGVRKGRAAKHQRVLLGNPTEARRVLQGFGWDLGPDGMPVLGGAGGGGHAPAAAGAGKPKTVTQNGHTYTLNEATGQYE